MYQLITKNNVSASPVQEFGTNVDNFQIVLRDKGQYLKILNLTNVPKDVVDSIIGKVSIRLSNKGLIKSAMMALFSQGLVDRNSMENVLQATSVNTNALSNEIKLAGQSLLQNDIKMAPKTLSDEEMTGFFNKCVQEKLGAKTMSPYLYYYDGALNPALKIYGATTKNKIENGRWEIFVLLKNEDGKLGMRSGVKCATFDYDHLDVISQFDFSNFKSPSPAEFSRVDGIKERLLNYRSGHPSLALNFNELDRNVYQTLPVFIGGWLLRNDSLIRGSLGDLVPRYRRIQVYWSSGRYNKDVSSEQKHLLQLCVAFNLMTEYGKDFIVEFYEYDSITMEKFITKNAFGGKCYDWKYVLEEVHQQIETINNKDQRSVNSMSWSSL